MAAETVLVLGLGGATFEVDVPAEGTMRREQFDAQLARGEISIVETDDAGQKPEEKPKRGRGRAAKPAEVEPETADTEGEPADDAGQEPEEG